MLKDTIFTRLEKQLNSEIYSAYLYFSMVGFFESINLKGFSGWMIAQAQEELTHAHRIHQYMLDRGRRPEMAPVEAPKHQWDSALDAMLDVYEHECNVSEQINECVTLALQENDHPTNAMLQWFVTEQIEEEATVDLIAQKLKLIGDDSSGLFLLDNELANRSFEAGAATGTA